MAPPADEYSDACSNVLTVNRGSHVIFSEICFSLVPKASIDVVELCK